MALLPETLTAGQPGRLARTVQQNKKLNNMWVDVRADLGAAGDGTTDDTTILQNAVANYPVVYFPPGVYLTNPLTPVNGVRLAGPLQSDFSFPPGSSRTATLKLKNGANANLIQGATGVSNVTLERLSFDGNKANNTAGAVIALADGTAQDADWRILDCYVDNSAADGIYVGVGRQACRIERTMVQRSTGHGMNIRGADTVIHGCLVGNSTLDGVYVDSTGSPGAWVIRVANTDVWNCRVGVNLQGPHMVTLTGVGIDRNMQHGIYVGANVPTATIIGCHLHINSRQTNAGYGHITMAGDGSVAVIGCHFEHEDATTYPNKASHAILVQGTTPRIFQFGNMLDTGATTNGAGQAALCSDTTKLVNEIAGPLAHLGAGLGFYGTTPVAKPTVTGSRGGNAALASLLTALADQGLITNSSSA